jgi:hypothetical protein
MRDDDPRSRWYDTDDSGLHRAHRPNGDTIEVIGEEAVSWTALPRLVVRARYGNVRLDFPLDRDAALREHGPRQTRILHVLDRVVWSHVNVRIGEDAPVPASQLAWRDWARIEGFLIDALKFWPGIRRDEDLRRGGSAGAHGAFERNSGYPPDLIDEVRAKPVFYGGWRNGRWEESLLKSLGPINVAWDWEYATGKHQLARAEQDVPGDDWQIDTGPKASISRLSTGQSLCFIGLRKSREVSERTPPGVSTSWARTNLYCHFEYRAGQDCYPLWVEEGFLFLPAPLRTSMSWRVDFVAASPSEAERRGDDYHLEMTAFVQDAVLNWRDTSLIFGRKTAGPPIEVGLRNVRCNGFPCHYELQVGRTTDVLRAFRD